jgi:hypothetical protein
MTSSFVLRLLIGILLAVHTWWVWGAVGTDDILVIKIAYWLTLILHGYHWVQWRLWVTRPDKEE